MKRPKSITTQDFNRTCRFCAKPSSDLKLIFKSDDPDPTTGESLSFPYLFKNTLNIDVIIDDRLPILICTKCSKKLTNANDFRKQCLKSIELLIEIYENEAKAKPPDTETVTEVPSSPSENVHVKTSDASDEPEPTVAPLVVIIKDEHDSFADGPSLDDYVKEEDSATSDDASGAFAAPLSNIAKSEDATDVPETKYKGRGRPRKGQEVKKEKRVPKPHPLEMCQICGQLFRCIKTHMFVHDTNPQFECHHCGRKFKHKPNLICHVKNHQNVRKFQCPHCPFKFQYSTNFKRHLRTHTGEKIFTCDICQKRFSRSGGLQRHKLTHDIPRVPCPYCEKMFTTTKGLVNHVGIHTGERPFKCKICGAAFVASSSLCVHSRIHKKENPVIQCKECGLVVTDNVMLTNHMKDHQEISAVK